jgi:hypothetical protein
VLPVASLYDMGWRQGSLLSAKIPLDTVILGSYGEPKRAQDEHDRWVVVTQDCDLHHTEADISQPTVELRPALVGEPPPDYGIRSVKFWLSEAEYLHATSPRAMVSAELLSAVLAKGDRDADIPADRQRALKTWLGLRYDRPAVPESLGELATRIGNEVARKKNRPVGMKVRDVLMQFDETQEPPRFRLYAVTIDPANRETVREWLAGISQGVPADLGIGEAVDAQPADLISLELIETSYSANVSQLTWRPSSPSPEGAEP